MIVRGKDLRQRKIKGLDMLYCEIPKKKLILIPKTKPLKDLIVELQLDNAVGIEMPTYYAFYVDRKAPEGYFKILPEFKANIFTIQNKEISAFKTLCHICKDKLKGLVDECKATDYWGRYQKSCNFDLVVGEMNIDLSKRYKVKFNKINRENPFLTISNNRYYASYYNSKSELLNDIDFTMDTINRNKKKYKKRRSSGNDKKEKIKKYCSKCIFQCENRVINMNNVDNKCCLTYEQALKSGFFKDIQFNKSTSIYYQGVRYKQIEPSREGYWGRDVINEVALTENKYNESGKYLKEDKPKK